MARALEPEILWAGRDIEAIKCFVLQGPERVGDWPEAPKPGGDVLSPEPHLLKPKSKFEFCLSLAKILTDFTPLDSASTNDF